MPPRMTQADIEARDQFRETLARIDERTSNIWRLTESQEMHLRTLNGTVAETVRRQTATDTTVYGKKTDKGLVGELAGLKKYLIIAFALILAGSGLSVAEILNVINLIG